MSFNLTMISHFSAVTLSSETPKHVYQINLTKQQTVVRLYDCLRVTEFPTSSRFGKLLEQAFESLRPLMQNLLNAEYSDAAYKTCWWDLKEAVKKWANEH